MRTLTLITAFTLLAASASARKPKLAATRIDPPKVEAASRMDTVKRGWSSFTGLFHGGASNDSASRSTSTREVRSEESSSARINGEEVERNGRPVGRRSDDDERAASSRASGGKGDFRAPCHVNDECSSGACYVGYQGNNGYCSKMCEDWDDCPSHWECERAGNSSYKICKQPRD